MILYFPIIKVEIQVFLIALSKLNCNSQNEFAIGLVKINQKNILSVLAWTLRKRYQLLIFGLIFALSINSCYSKDRGCYDVGDWLTE